MLKTKVKPIATGARWAGRPATAVLAYLARMGAGPEKRLGRHYNESLLTCLPRIAPDRKLAFIRRLGHLDALVSMDLSSFGIRIPTPSL
jgi:hypothetical protein